MRISFRLTEKRDEGPYVKSMCFWYKDKVSHNSHGFLENYPRVIYLFGDLAAQPFACFFINSIKICTTHSLCRQSSCFLSRLSPVTALVLTNVIPKQIPLFETRFL